MIRTILWSSIRILIALIAISMAVATPVLAHVLKTDGTIGAVIHVSPEDDPVAGEPSDFFFDFKDTAGRYKPALCTCTVTITSQGQHLYSESLFSHQHGASLTTSSLTYTFPKRDVYQVIIKGVPKEENAFQSFTLTYDIRVQREATSAATQGAETNSNWVPILSALVVTSLFVMFVIIDRRRSKRAGLKKQLLKALVLISVGLAILPVFEGSVHMHAASSHQRHECCIAPPITLTVPMIAFTPQFVDHVPSPKKITFSRAAKTLQSHNKSPPLAAVSA